MLPLAAPAAEAQVDVYVTEGTHTVNGRQWRTKCEKYSSTERCRTEIMATVVSYDNGKFVPKTGWAFNSLTYKAAAPTLWGKNPLANTGTWTAPDGRKWRTECRTPRTGGDACRNYIVASVIESYKNAKGAWAYRWVTKEVFNSQVRFTTRGSVTPPGPVTYALPDPRAIADPALRQCITEAAGVPAAGPLTAAALATIEELDCNDRGITTLKGMPVLPNVYAIGLNGNAITSTAGFPVQPELFILGLNNNALTDLKGLPSQPTLSTLAVGYNQIASLDAMAEFRGMSILINNNKLTTLANLKAPNAKHIAANDNLIATVDGLPARTGLVGLGLSRNKITTVAPLVTLTGLDWLQLSGNPVTDAESLRRWSTQAWRSTS